MSITVIGEEPFVNTIRRYLHPSTNVPIDDFFVWENTEDNGQIWIDHLSLTIRLTKQNGKLSIEVFRLADTLPPQEIRAEPLIVSSTEIYFAEGVL